MLADSCSCCCEALLAYKRLGSRSQISNNFTSKLNLEKCTSYGVCVNFCNAGSLTLKRTEKVNFVPKTSMERIILEAINEGELQNLVFDNYELWTYDLLREFLSIILKLKPVKLLMANKQLMSRYIRAALKAKNIK